MTDQDTFSYFLGQNCFQIHEPSRLQQCMVLLKLWTQKCSVLQTSFSKIVAPSPHKILNKVLKSSTMNYIFAPLRG